MEEEKQFPPEGKINISITRSMVDGVVKAVIAVDIIKCKEDERVEAIYSLIKRVSVVGVLKLLALQAEDSRKNKIKSDKNVN